MGLGRPATSGRGISAQGPRCSAQVGPHQGGLCAGMNQVAPRRRVLPGAPQHTLPLHTLDPLPGTPPPPLFSGKSQAFLLGFIPAESSVKLFLLLSVCSHSQSSPQTPTLHPPEKETHQTNTASQVDTRPAWKKPAEAHATFCCNWLSPTRPPAS